MMINFTQKINSEKLTYQFHVKNDHIALGKMPTVPTSIAVVSNQPDHGKLSAEIDRHFFS